MADDLLVATGNKTEMYNTVVPQIKAIIDGEPNLISNLGNICAALKEQFDWLWVGFYLVQPNVQNNGEELVLSCFQGPIACTRIKKGKGVCGSSWEQQKTLIVPDVDAFPGHIACSSLSKSEIVLPIIRHGQVIGVLDVDSVSLNTFDEVDQQFLQEILNAVAF